MLLPSYSKLLFIGDSIADAGRESMGEPSPWDSAALGRGYVAFVEAWLTAVHPAARVRAFLAEWGAL
jgi:hypothetical protein